jgi:hypothetical protein
MSKCIYCPNEANSEEHHLPYCLGKFKGYVVLADRICSECNGKCGKLDEQLCRSGIEAFFRKYLEIEGRSGHEKVNPFHRGSARGKRLEMIAVNQKTGENVPLELVGGNKVTELRRVTLTADDDSTHVITILDDMTPEQFKERIDALSIKTFKTGDICAADEEIPWVESLVQKGLKFESRTQWTHSTLGPILYGPAKIKITVNARYFRCIAKIGFHYFLTKMPQFRGDESCFTEIRHLIITDGSLQDCGRFVAFAKSPLGNAPYLEHWGHVLSAEADYLRLGVRVQLFAGPGVQARVYSVALGRNPSRIDYTQYLGDFFGYYPKEERNEFDGEVAELL